MIALKKMSEIDLYHKRVMIREDFNVPMQEGHITSDARIRAALPTIQQALQQQAAVILLSHLGRPNEGEFSAEFSLAPVANCLSELLNKPVRLISDWLNGIDIHPGEIVLCENVRFNVGEEKDNDQLAKRMAALCDVFVMDAFGTAHRAQASTHGIAKYAPMVCAGPLLLAELDALSTALANPKRPLIAIIGGSKVSTKLHVLKVLLEKVDHLIVGGGIANTFMAAAGLPIGKSLCEAELIPTAKELLAIAEKKGATIPLPIDVVVAKELSANAFAEVKMVNDIVADDMILDIGSKTSECFAREIAQAGTILWNGPVGVFEMPQFADGTKRLAHAIAVSRAYSIAGGGDTLAAIDQFGVSKQISYVSTGGGAFLEFIEGKTLPAIEILEQRANT